MDDPKALRDPRRVVAMVRVAVEWHLDNWRTRRIGVDDPDDLVAAIVLWLCEEPSVLDRFDPKRGTPQSYIFRIVQHRLTDHLRKHGRRAELDREHVPSAGLQLLPDDPELIVRAREAKEHVEQNLAARCSPTDQKIFEHAFIDGMSNPEIADELGLPNERVTSRIFALRTRITGWLGDIGIKVPGRKKS